MTVAIHMSLRSVRITASSLEEREEFLNERVKNSDGRCHTGFIK
jgi:hypothetical protein